MKKDKRQKTVLPRGNWSGRRIGAFAATAGIAVVSVGAAAGCSTSSGQASQGNPSYSSTQDLNQLNQNSNLVQGRDGCIKALVAADNTKDSLAVKASNAAQTCDAMIAQAQAQTAYAQGEAQGQAQAQQQFNNDALMWFMLSSNGPPMMYYGNANSGLHMWYSDYALHSGSLGQRYGFNNYSETTIKNYTSGSNASAPKTLSKTQTSYLKASPEERPGISAKAAAEPGAKIVKVSGKTTGGLGGTHGIGGK
jgi:hypothetical protein